MMSREDILKKIKFAPPKLIVSRTKKVGKEWYSQYKCFCGQLFQTSPYSVNTGHTKSCGCIKLRVNSNYKHGLKATKIYWVWAAMLARCNNKKNKQYKNYGGRGITVCKRWYTFKLFIEDMGQRPGANSTLERINNNSGYSLANCKWATRHTQSRNTRRCRMLTFNNITKCLSDWAAHLGMTHSSIRYRIDKGWSLHKTLTTPSSQTSTNRKQK